MDQKMKQRAQRGFTLIELMLVVVIIGVMSSIAIPMYTRASARAYRAESQVVLSKLELFFRTNYQSNGVFSTGKTSLTPDVMPDPTGSVLIGTGFDWTPRANKGWEDVPFPPQGNIRMRYTYQINDAATPPTVILAAYGSFPGFGAGPAATINGLKYNYSFSEVMVATPSGVVVDDAQTVVYPGSGVAKQDF
jgi:prepilin-type N-terminal cleavage/methylation domain-containing protein